MYRVSRCRGLPVLLLGAGLAAGCNGSGPSGVPHDGPSQSQATELARALQDEIEFEISALTVAAPGTPPGAAAPAGCPAVSGTHDSDGDGVLDNATFTFAVPPCKIDGFNHGTMKLTGEIGIQDPNFSNSTSYDLTLTDMAWVFTDSAGVLDYTATRNGTRSRLGSSDAASDHGVATTERRRPQISAVATIGLDLDWGFTAADPGSLQLDQPLPDGSLSVSGSLHWHRSTENWDLTVTTVQPLVYDAGCATTPHRISAGQVNLAGTVAGQPGTLVLEWSACGEEPSPIWVPGS